MTPSTILTIEPVTIGGVPAMVRAADSLLRRWGHPPTLVYTDAESVPTGGWRSLAGYFARRPLPRREQRDGLEGLAIPLWPLPQWLSYYAPLIAARAVLRQARIRLLISGSAHAGLALALDRRPYIAWIATLYGEELEARASVGDQWARSLLAGSTWPRLQKQEALILERASLVLALSPHTAQAIRQHYPATEPRLRTLVCPINTDLFRPTSDSEITQHATRNTQHATRREAPRAERAGNTPFLLLTARIRDPRKNVGLLLRAFAQVRTAQPHLRLIIAGDDPPPAIRALAAELGLTESVHFAGALPLNELIALYQSATLFTLPSLQEGLGISALEAIACGTPVISTRCGGPEGFVIEGETGWLVPNNDEHAFAAAILNALSDSERLATLRRRCRQYAERELARPVVEAKLLSALRDVFPAEFASTPARASVQARGEA